MIYIISDTHFSHEKIIKFCGRPENHEELIQKQLEKLTSEDTLIHLGDVCMGDDINVHAKYIEPLICKKILVLGNHDHKSDTWYQNHGWDFTCRSFTTKQYGKKIIFSHKPRTWDGEWELNIHGHLHNLGHREGEHKMKNWHHLISLEDNGYRTEGIRNIIEKHNDV